MNTDPDNTDALASTSDADLRAELFRRLERAGDNIQGVGYDQVLQLDLGHPPTGPVEPLPQIGYLLATRLPVRWEKAFLDATSAADDVRTICIVRMQQEVDTSNDNRVYFFFDLAEPVLALRRATYEPHRRGAWYHAQIKLSRDGTIEAKFDFDTPPFGPWGPNESALALRDQETYPRPPAQLPKWHPAR